MSNDKAGFYGQIGHIPRETAGNGSGALRLGLLPLAAQFGSDFRPPDII
jgi:hypothetical protein